MKLLYCIPALNNAGGMERMLTLKANYLAGIPGFEVSVVTTDQQDRPTWFSLDDRITLYHLNLGFDEHYAEPLPKKYFYHKKKLRQYRKELNRLTRTIGPDILISMFGKEIAFLHRVRPKVRTIGEIHFSMHMRKLHLASIKTGVHWRLLGDFRTWQLIRSANQLDKLVVLTEKDRLQWEKHLSGVVNIPNPNPLEHGSARSALIQKKVISVGRLDPQKGYDMLIDAWKLVSEKHPDWSLDIYGEGKCRTKLNQKITTLHLDQQVVLKGVAPEVSSAYLNGSIYVMSSRYEGYPLVIIEAMSCGLPVVSFDCPQGPGEMVQDGVNGFLVRPGDIRELANIMILLIEDQALRKQLGAQARESSKQYALEKIMPKWIKVFMEVVGKDQQTSPSG